MTRAAARCGVSQPAVTQALNKLERRSGGRLFARTRQGLFTTLRGDVLVRRVRRALDLLDPALDVLSPRLILTATMPQLVALVVASETGSFTLAARRLNLAQPTVHRAVSQLEREAARPLFERTAHGIVATRQAKPLIQKVRLAFAELDQAEADLAELDGREVGRIVVGALPLSRSVILPRALVAFRAMRPVQKVTVIDGLYDELLGGLRRGDVDFILGALRDPRPIADVVQEPLFSDRLTVVARPDHPLSGATGLPMSALRDAAWVVAREGTPARNQFERWFAQDGAPGSIIETGSILLMREILLASDHLGCISGAQAEAETSKGLLTRIDVDCVSAGRPIGLTIRVGWMPTTGQSLMLDLIRKMAEGAGGGTA